MKKVIYFFLVVLLALIYTQYDLIKYGLSQAYGQLSIVWQARPVDEYLNDPAVPDSVRQKLAFVQVVRQYAVSNLGLNDTENYTTMYDQHGEPILWVVTGCEPFQFEPKQWHFPVLGDVPYKGFFDPEMAAKEYVKVKNEGYDAGVRTVGGWSTLGWFKDPILSEMLSRDKGQLANLIIHELVHATVFVRDSIEFNENLASFIADKGTLIFLKDHFGETSAPLREYLEAQHDEDLYISHILHGVTALEDLYKDLEAVTEVTKKQKAKEQLIQRIMDTTDTLNMNDKTYLSFVRGELPNNTYFMSFMRYRSKQNDLEKLYKQKFNEEIKPFVDYMKQKYPYL